MNFVLHPLSGSETHVLGRSRGWSFTESFLFDAAASIGWEYVFENVYERPSRTDLMVTAPAGALLGECTKVGGPKALRELVDKLLALDAWL